MQATQPSPLIGHRIPDLPLRTLGSLRARAGVPAETPTIPSHPDECGPGKVHTDPPGADGSDPDNAIGDAIGETLLERYCGRRFVLSLGMAEHPSATQSGLDPQSADWLPMVAAMTPEAARAASRAADTLEIAVAARAILASLQRDASAPASPSHPAAITARASGGPWLLIDERGFIRDVIQTGMTTAADAAIQRHRDHPSRDLPAPVLAIPDVLPASLCTALIARLNAHSHPSGYLAPAHVPDVPNAAGFVVDRRLASAAPGRLHIDLQRKCRRDHWLEDPALLASVQLALARRVLPAISKSFHFSVTNHEGFKVVAFSAQPQGHFSRHRDNTATAVRHRRFALSLGLSDDYAGGELVFPEYSDRGLRLHRGEALVFSGSLLHQVLPVSRGTRHALISFFW